MMPEIVIGARSIRYDVRRSSKARRKRIEVTPRGVEIIVPRSASTEDVKGFVQRKRRWIHEKVEEVREVAELLRGDTPEGFHSGAKILFRGRHLRLRVRIGDVQHPTIAYRTAFDVELPRALSNGDREPTVQKLVEEWLEERLTEDAWDVVRLRGVPYGLKPRDVRVKEQRTLWGSCGRDGVIRLDRKLARVPKAVFEYVVVHELCHLEHRDHSPAFWSLVRQVMPNYQERKHWLEAHEVSLG